MVYVDALSRFPVILIMHDSVLLKLKSAQDHIKEIRTIKEILQTKRYKVYSMKNGILDKFVDGTDLVLIPQSILADVIKNAHQRGDFASKRIEEIIKQNYYIPKLKVKIEK